MSRRTSNPAPGRTSTTVRRVSVSGLRGQPLGKLRTLDETADILNASTRTVRRLIDSGALPVHRFGRLVRIADADIALLLAASRSA
jgi:excisionase family DNA binding protein